ncbi:MAG TPA: phage holin family protein [Ramlibacter sp.]|nr:phage holin family protein [Ramlibacter sp.]
MFESLTQFLLQWGITGLSLWVASHIFKGLRFDNAWSLVIAALLLGFANAIVKPLLIVLTLPLTLVTFGLFVLVINALMILLVASLVKGFKVSSFWTAFFASIFISILSVAMGALTSYGDPETEIRMPEGTTWL